MEIKRIKKMGTVEPEYFGVLKEDNPFAFIAGAIKKYGADSSFHDELKDYILKLIWQK